MSRRRSGRVLMLAGGLPGLVAAVLCVFQPSLFTRIDYGLYDRMVRAAGTTPPGGRVVIVDVDERSLAAVGQWPWPRGRVAELIDALVAHGAATVAIDIVFAEPDRAATAGHSPDDVLAASLAAGPAVLGYALTFDPATERAPDCLKHAVNVAVITTDAAEPAAPPYFQATRAICNLAVLTAAAPATGFLNAAPDADGILRRAPVLLEYNDRTYPSLALAAVSSVTAVRGSLLRVSNVNTSSLELTGRGENGAEATRIVPLDGRSNLLVRYRGDKRTFPYVSAVDVLERRLPDGALQDKVVFLGTTALGTREVVATPLDTLFTGVEVQATVADNLLQQDYFRRPEHALTIEALATLLAGTAVTVAAAGLGLAAGLGTGALLLAGVWGGAVFLLRDGGLVLSPLYPMLGLAGGLACLGLVGLRIEHRRAEHAGVARAASQRLMVQTLLALVEVRDAETGRHSRRTQQYARVLAQALSRHPAYRPSLPPERIELIAALAPLHDIGKVGIADHILHKPGRLTPDEFAEMQKHPVYGRDVIVNAERAAGVRDDESLSVAKDIVYSHHERWDGTGYPEGLRGEEIPITGRLIALVDVYDAMRSPRPYHRAMTHDEVQAIVCKGRGTHFDPNVVDAFLEVAATMRVLSEHGEHASATSDGQPALATSA
jgi:CHASE2 domain-containing sensor protein